MTMFDFECHLYTPETLRIMPVDLKQFVEATKEIESGDMSEEQARSVRIMTTLHQAADRFLDKANSLTGTTNLTTITLAIGRQLTDEMDEESAQVVGYEGGRLALAAEMVKAKDSGEPLGVDAYLFKNRMCENYCLILAAFGHALTKLGNYYFDERGLTPDTIDKEMGSDKAAISCEWITNSFFRMANDKKCVGTLPPRPCGEGGTEFTFVAGMVEELVGFLENPGDYVGLRMKAPQSPQGLVDRANDLNRYMNSGFSAAESMNLAGFKTE